jgi:hypothetical protein
MVSVANSYNNTPVSDAVTALTRSGSSSAAASSAQGSASSASDANSRGPAVLVTLSPQRSPVLSDDVAKTLTDQVQQNTDALATLDQNSKSTAEQRKADAKEKLDQARKKLETLQIIGGDPATIAKQAKAIGEEIKTAASEYSSALKSEIGGNTTAGGASAAAGSTTPGTNASPADAAAADSATAATAATGTTATLPDGSVTGGSNTSTAVDSTEASASLQAVAKVADPAATAQTVVQAYQNAADRAAANTHFDPIEENVLASFKGAARDVKAVLENAARELKAKDPIDHGAHAGANTEVEIDKAIQDLSDTIRIKESGGNTDISIGSDTSAAPALDIQA